MAPPLHEPVSVEPSAHLQAVEGIVERYYRNCTVGETLHDVETLFRGGSTPESLFRAREARELKDAIQGKVTALRGCCLEALASGTPALRERIRTVGGDHGFEEVEREVLIRALSTALREATPEQREQVARALERTTDLPKFSREAIGRGIRAGELGSGGGVFLVVFQRNPDLVERTADLLSHWKGCAPELSRQLQGHASSLRELVGRLKKVLKAEARQLLIEIGFQEYRPEEQKLSREPEQAAPSIGSLPQQGEHEAQQGYQQESSSSHFLPEIRYLQQVARRVAAEAERGREIREQIQRMIQRLSGEEPLALATGEGSTLSQADYRLPPTDGQYVQAIEAGKRLRAFREKGSRSTPS